MKKIIIFSFGLLFLFTGFSYAFNEFNYENAKNIAKDYISNSSFDENWNGTNPVISGEGKYFYTDSDSPSYIEFKVSCDKNPNCGFIMVNFDGDDVSIPIASTSGNTPSEVLVAQNGEKVDDNKLYYFSPFEQFSENLKSGDISSIDPQDNIENELAQDPKLTKEQKQEKRKKFKSDLKNRVNKAKKEASDFKKSDDFKSKKKELKEKKLRIPKDDFSFKILPFEQYANATGVSGSGTSTGYTLPTTSNIFVPGYSFSGCNGKLPCYSQTLNVNYNGKTCAVGCVPLAYGMIYGYYDRNGKYPNLLTGTASTTNDNNSRDMVLNLGLNYLMTTCSGAIGGTTLSNSTNGIKYAIDKGYTKSTANILLNTTITYLFTNIKSEIDAGRPVIANIKDHSMVAFGYNSNSGLPIVRLNLGAGTGFTVTATNLKSYYGSDIDYNINSLYYDNKDHLGVTSIIKIVISK